MRDDMQTLLAPWRREFLEYCMQIGVLLFGEFTLKSGRKSPYFFNAGLFNTGQAFEVLGDAYARLLREQWAARDYDGLYGPPYKAIGLVQHASRSLFALSDRNVIAISSRKEVKDHGEGGALLGAKSIEGMRLLILDDVVTAGTAIGESVDFLRVQGAEPAGVVLMLDRQEVGKDGKTYAIAEIGEKYGLRVTPIINLDNISAYLTGMGDAPVNEERELTAAEALERIEAYRAQYGAA